MQYFFILGKNPSLSAAEILSLLGRDKVNFKTVALVAEVLILETEKELDIDYLMRQLGGVIKVGLVLADKYQNIGELRANELIKLFLSADDRKAFFGFSYYALEPKIKLYDFIGQARKLGLEVKSKLKERGRGARIVTDKQGPTLSAVTVKKNKLLTRGAEIVFLVGEEKIYLGKTLAVQEFEEYGFRDFGRPARDILSGTMPPKLAKMMINLAGVNFDNSILDPFCGSGTIISEAALMGYKNLIGSDISEKAISDTKKNMEWMGKNFRFKIEDLRLFNIDARGLSEVVGKNSIDAVVTEPYLGPPQKQSATREEMERVLGELGKLYLEAFESFKNILKPGGRAVMVFPAFRPGEKAEIIYLPILAEIKKLGFEIKKFSEIRVTERGSMVYSRPDQRVLREIFVWEKK